jgi:hypothetical protein
MRSSQRDDKTTTARRWQIRDFVLYQLFPFAVLGSLLFEQYTFATVFAACAVLLPLPTVIRAFRGAPATREEEED